MFFSPLDLEMIDDYQVDWLLGCDEVGRGCLAGPVVGACAAINVSKIPSHFLENLGVNDSKTLSVKKRQAIINELNIKWDFSKESSVVFKNSFLQLSYSQVDAVVIDDINIFQSSLLAMANAAKLLKTSRSKLLLVDGKWDLGDKVKVNQLPIIKGDSKSKVIALASVIAKEFRDSLMEKIDRDHPEFQFRNNVGYPTKFHKQAIKQHGILPIHRKTFKGVKEYVPEGNKG